MARGAYVGVGGVAKKISKGYVGVNGVARKIIKAYIGVNGIARPLWGYDKITKYKWFYRSDHGEDSVALTVGNYALIAGGEGGNGGSTSVSRTLDIVSSSLTCSSSTLYTQRKDFDGATIGNYAVFVGGVWEYSTGNDLSSIEAYNSSLSRTIPSSMSTTRHFHAVGTTGNYLVIAGGINYKTDLKTVEAYNSSLTKITISISNLSEAKSRISRAKAGNYIIFGGGETEGKYGTTTVDAYNSSLTRTIPSVSLSGSYCQRTGVSVNNQYALFMGGYISTYQTTTTVRGYDSSLTAVYPTGLPSGRYNQVAVSLKSSALVVGGKGDSGTQSQNAFYYTSDLTRETTDTADGMQDGFCSGTALGNYAIVAGSGTMVSVYQSS